MKNNQLYRISGLSYIGIFFLAIFGNFFVLESLKDDPLSVSVNLIGLGAMAFLVAAVLDIVVAWALNQLYAKHQLTPLSTYFRITHAVLMGAAVYALVLARGATDAQSIDNQIAIFDTIWLIGLFFFGIHVVLLSKILKNATPTWVNFALLVAGVMYVIDTTAHFTMSNYDSYADTFLTLVAIPSIVGEMALSVWLLVKSRQTR